MVLKHTYGCRAKRREFPSANQLLSLRLFEGKAGHPHATALAADAASVCCCCSTIETLAPRLSAARVGMCCGLLLLLLHGRVNQRLLLCAALHKLLSELGALGDDVVELRSCAGPARARLLSVRRHFAGRCFHIGC
jgi:hypothetical protein